MPFGGRRGGGGPKGPAGLDWEIKYEGISWKPEKTWPPMVRPITAPLTAREIDEVNRFRQFRDMMRESPIYTVRGRPKVHKPDAAFDKRANHEPFMPHDYARTYTQRYQRPKRTIPDLTTRPYVLELFPEELHWVLGADKNKTNADGETTKKLDIAGDDWKSRLERMAEEEEPPEDFDENMDENEDDDNKSDKDNEDDPNADENLEEDESEDDDYNAERYFDGGEDDEGDMGTGAFDGGGGDGDDYD